MGSISGSSMVYSYGDEGGIMLMSSNAYDPGTVTGGSGGDSGGDYGIPARISWTITYDGTNYSGGITGVSFYLEAIPIYDTQGNKETIYGPFYQKNVADLYAEAVNTGDLDDVFIEWNSMYSESVTKFISFLEDRAPQCVSKGVVTG